MTMSLRAEASAIVLNIRRARDELRELLDRAECQKADCTQIMREARDLSEEFNALYAFADARWVGKDQQEETVRTHAEHR